MTTETLQDKLDARADAEIQSALDGHFNAIWKLYKDLEQHGAKGHVEVNFNGVGQMTAYPGSFWNAARESIFIGCRDANRARYCAEFIAQVEKIQEIAG